MIQHVFLYYLLIFINSSSTWQLHFSKEFEKKFPDQKNPFVSGENTNEMVNYFTMPLDTRIHLLFLLSEVYPHFHSTCMHLLITFL